MSISDLCLRTGVLICLLACSRLADATQYRIDPTATTAGFEVHLLGLFPIRGDFKHTTGTLFYDPQSKQGNIDVFIDSTTVDASTAYARTSVRGPDFFNVEKFPSIDFRSSRFVFESDKLKIVEGMLTLTGVSQPVSLEIMRSHCEAASPMEVAVCRADAKLVVQRSAFGMTAWAHALSDTVTIRVRIVARDAALPARETAPISRESAANPREGVAVARDAARITREPGTDLPKR